MKKSIIGLLAAIPLALAGCTVSTDPPVEEAVPTVTVTATPSPSEGNQFYQNAIEAGWGDLSPKEKEQTCFLYLVSPDEAWEAFDEGAEGLIPRSEFEIFLDDACEVFNG